LLAARRSMKMAGVARLTPAKCPNCGAGLTIPRIGDWVKCAYCGISCFVNRAPTRGLPAPAPPAGAVVVHVSPASRGARYPYVAIFVVVMVIGLGIAGRRLTRGGLRSAVLVGRPFLFDVNGDGTEDVIINAFYLGGSRLHLRAIDGGSGAVLWASPSLMGTGEDEFAAAVPGALLVFANGEGTSLDPKTGKARYKFALPERADALCNIDGRPVLLTLDGQLHGLNLQDGTLKRQPSRHLGCGPSALQCQPTFGYRTAPPSRPSTHSNFIHSRA
jgi:hypothetical protein